ncbi:YncE family protein [Terriglobus sp. TAA 43]|uniref:YncE family protein n=1 Tax=Terriglobus sp. TAA 43 TaxID=278961 RepID=UPI000A06185A|nr:YncE family protein [Terriglobus sp. TAA 43]
MAIPARDSKHVCPHHLSATASFARRLSAAAIIAAFLVAGITVQAQDTPKSALLVISKREHALAIVDPSNLKVIAKVPVGDDPHEVTASSDGHTAYVSNYGSGAFHSLAVIDLVHHQALTAIDLGALTGPHGLTFVDGKVWFTAEGAKVMGRYDPAADKVDLVVGTGQNRTHMISVTPGGDHIITTNVSSGTVSLIDKESVRIPGPPPGMTPPPGAPRPPQSGPGARTDWNQTVVRVGNGSEGFDLSPDGREVWVANAQDGTISIIDRQSKSVVQTLQVNVAGANRLKFTPDGRRVLVSTLSGSDLTILDAHTRKVEKRIPIGHGAAGIVMQPDGKRAFVACSPDNYVAVIDLNQLTMTGKFAVGDEPDGMTWAARP